MESNWKVSWAIETEFQKKTRQTIDPKIKNLRKAADRAIEVFELKVSAVLGILRWISYITKL